jgi:beta-exotoxin I transport system ATP-binding protein
MSDLAIETRGLSIRYAGGAGVHELDLAVARGEIFGFLGPNGAGKTTTIRMLLDLLRPDSGEARVLGVAVREGGGELRRRLGFVPGDLALPAGVTGLQALDLFARLAGRAPSRRHEVLERLGFPSHFLKRRVKHYSTGMRQMVGLACAMQHDPELLILDEPTTGLDPMARDVVLTLLKEGRARGRTIFLSSHVLDEVERVCDRVGVIHRGRLHRVAAVAELRFASRRTVTLVHSDGRLERFVSDEPAQALLERIRRASDGAPLRDVEIRAAALDEIFREIVGGDGDHDGHSESHRDGTSGAAGAPP